MQRYHLQRLKLKFGSINLQLLMTYIISRLSRMSSVLHGAPQYPRVHKAFNKKVTVQVQIIEQNGNQKSEVIEETVDDEADGFIQQKHKDFGLCKWKTFKSP
ncbi:hypothetical protein POTOM_050585 [Populus tomentosa]|uniref:Uncharacterized protein n=1 Tax=Populus tomentosa TaxID=118781 RepID=A0A8X7YC21_POPTO|nr:hypothetical protein POTOM_050585 [Populus tomentosa]